MSRQRAVTLLAIGAAALAIGACGDDEAAAPASTSATTTTPPMATSVAVTIAAEPTTSAAPTTAIAPDSTAVATTSPAPPPSIAAPGDVDLDVAAATVRDIIRIGDEMDAEPGNCPYGPTADLARLLPDDLPVSANMRAGDVEDDGQLWLGGEPNLVYCPLYAGDAVGAEMNEFRVDVAAGESDVIAYLDQNFDTVEASDLEVGPALLGTDIVHVCHSRGCTAALQAGELFVAVTLIDDGENPVTAEQAVAAMQAIGPVVADRLATLGVLRAEIDALAHSYWDDVFADEDWDAWRAFIQSGDEETYAGWVAFEIEQGTVTQAEGETMLALLDQLP